MGLHKRTGELLAVKEIKLDIMEIMGDVDSNDKDIASYENELRVLTKLSNHPNVIHFRGYLMDDESKQLSLFLEYLPTDLKKQIKDFGPFSTHLHKKYTRQLLEGHAATLANSWQELSNE